VAGAPGYNGEYAADANIIIAATVRQSAIHIKAAAAEAAQGIEDKVSASFKNGVLTVTMPKLPQAESKVKRIAINSK
jgi:Hsp20/alpha crystallin family